MGANTVIQQNPASGQNEVFQKYQAALKLLCCRVLGEPYNFRSIDAIWVPAMGLVNDYFSEVITEAQKQFRNEGRYSPHSIGAATKWSVPDLLTYAQADTEIDIPAAWSMFSDAYGQWVELQIADSVRTWINEGQGTEEIKISGDKVRREKGLTSHVVNDDGKADFERDLINAIECKATVYPVRPPTSGLQQAIPFFEPGEYIVVAGRTGMGKSYFGLNANYQCALDNAPSCYLNLENTPKNVQRRLWQMHTGVKWQRTYPGIPDHQIELMMEGWDWVKNKCKVNTYTPGRSLQSVLNTIRMDYYENGCQMAVVDYLQKISEPTFKGTRVDQLAEISASLRQLASDLKIPIYALAQINRESEKSADKRPSISDIRGSGDIEQDASTILLLYRPGYYNITEDETGDIYPEGYADIFVGKGRDTEQVKIKCRFNEVYGFHDAPQPTMFPASQPTPSAIIARVDEKYLPF